ncbi:hypothetical protein GCM10027515_08780 [Schumannella luteola]|uniref:Uncharacterized protein n=1 Tax=Schumannella luteola TaxID=472059 RepID=A0A852Y9M5_9MICO|nr:hypothetical protein [Schumannella luteola]NYG97994.1 hypothetical protein [Schumannella luteola]TPX01728.1 hypothetical protein FJ656_25360 [Schumannella luteola]
MTTASTPDARTTEPNDTAGSGSRPDSGAADRTARDALRDALVRTAAQGRVLIELTLDTSGTNAALQRTRGRGPVLALARTLFRAAPDVLTTRGLIDFTTGHAAGARPAIAWLEHDGRVWHGMPGRELARLDPTPATPRIAPLTLLALLAQAQQVSRLEPDADADANARTAAAETATDATIPRQRERFAITTLLSADADSPALDAEVTTADGMLHTVRARCGRDLVTLVLFAHPSDPAGADALDWTRLPDPDDPAWSRVLAEFPAAD